MYAAEIERIAGGLLRGEIGFLFGAGMSIGSGISSGPEMAKKMLRFAVLGETKTTQPVPDIDEIATKYPFEAVSELCRTAGLFRDLSKWLKEYGGFKDPKQTKAHDDLKELYTFLIHHFPQILFTTNFDTLIEDALGREKGGENSLPITSENLSDFHTARQEKKIAVIHLHGCIEYPGSLISGEERQAIAEGMLFDLFRSELAKQVFVFVGYSLSDTNLRSLFFDIQRVSKTRQGLDKRMYAVSPAKGDLSDPHSEASIAKKIWDLRDVTHLALRADEFFESLLQATVDFTVYKAKEYVSEKLRIDGESLQKMAQSLAEQVKYVIKWQDIILYLYYTLVRQA
jgi:hypothetical protein